jgi:hypothetical protein
LRNSSSEQNIAGDLAICLDFSQLIANFNISEMSVPKTGSIKPIYLLKINRILTFGQNEGKMDKKVKINMLFPPHRA